MLRLDALSARYKTQSEGLERSEEELKLEKRKLQREVSFFAFVLFYIGRLTQNTWNWCLISIPSHNALPTGQAKVKLIVLMLSRVGCLSLWTVRLPGEGVSLILIVKQSARETHNLATTLGFIHKTPGVEGSTNEWEKQTEDTTMQYCIWKVGQW